MKPPVVFVLAALALVGCAGRVSYEPAPVDSPVPSEAPAESHGEACEVGDARGVVVEGDDPPEGCPRMANLRGSPSRWCCL